MWDLYARLYAVECMNIKKEKNNRGTEKPKKENAQVIFPFCSAFISNWMPS